MTDICEAREVSTVQWRFHPLSYCVWDENICPSFGGILRSEKSVVRRSHLVEAPLYFNKM